MPFEEYGYLGTQILEMKKSNMDAEKDLFEIGIGALELAYEIMYSAEISKEDNRKIFILASYCKIVESYNSTLILSNYGLLSDSRSILRVLIEATFLFSALINDEQLFEQFLIKGDYETYELLKRIKKNSEEYNRELNDYASKKDLNELDLIVSKYKKEDFYTKNLATKANMKDLYFYVYHKLCEDVHTNVKSLMCYLEFEEEKIIGLNPLPKFSEQKYVLITAISVLLRTMKNLNECLGLAKLNSIEMIENKLKPYFSDIS